MEIWNKELSMNVLIWGEYSGKVRDAFIKKGHNAISVDFLPTEKPGPHIQGDGIYLLNHEWDMIIGHPPCTFLCNSGVSWLHKDISRWEKMVDAAKLFKTLLNANCDKICIENPIMHKYAVAIIGRRQDQVIQPWQFGHGETKATCLWLKGLEPLKPTDIVDGREQRLHKLPPSKDRGKLRSETYQGVADAMAAQWG